MRLVEESGSGAERHKDMEKPEPKSACRLELLTQMNDGGRGHSIRKTYYEKSTGS
jgi:hypothetical protein